MTADNGFEQSLVDELARVLYDADSARLVAVRAGFPRGALPAFRTSLTFWTQVVQEALNGRIHGGIQPIARAAADFYPHNPRFSAVLSSLQVEQGAVPTPSPAGLELLAQRFFEKAGRTVHAGSEVDLRVPESVQVRTALPQRAELRALGSRLGPGEIGYLVHRGTLSADSEEELNNLRLQGMLIVPITEQQIRAALQDGNARTVLHELTQRGRGGDNLFLTRNALIDRRFVFGRSELLARMGSALGRGEQILITGSRKLGKTSFLNILRQNLSEWPVAHLDLQRYDRNDSRWVEHLLDEIVAAYDRWGKARFGDWPGEPEVVSDGRTLERALLRRREWHGERENPTQLVVILDELERLIPRDGERDMARAFIRAAGALRALAQGQERFLSIIAADLRPTANRLNDLGGVGTNPLFRFFQELPLPPLTSAATQDMLQTLGGMMGIGSIDRAFEREIVLLSGGHPYLARTMAGAAAACRHDPGRLTLADLHEGLLNLEEDDELGDFFRANFWKPLTDHEQSYLVAVATGRTPPLNRQVAAALKHQGLTDRHGIRMRAFRDWIVEALPADERVAQ